jgi:hypothetical protein
MKFVLTLYLFSFVNIQQPVPLATHIIPMEFKTYKECILQGYKSAHNTLKELYGEKIEKQKLAIKFECKEITTGI